MLGFKNHLKYVLSEFRVLYNLQNKNINFVVYIDLFSNPDLDRALSASSSASVLARWPSQNQLSYALRSALAVLKEVRTTRAVLPPASSQAWAAVPVPWTSQTRHSATFGVSVPPRGPGFSTLPSRSFARSDHARGFQAVATLDSAVSSRPLMTVSQARDTLRRVGSTSLQLPRGVSSTSTLSRTVSSSWSVPRSYQPSAQSCSGARSTTLSVPGRSTQRPDSVEVSEDPFQVSSSVPGCSVLLRAPHTHRLGEEGCVD